MKTYLAMYRCADGRQAVERISDTSLQDALGRAKWRGIAVALAHGVAWPAGVELVGIEELQEDAPTSGLARAAVLAARLAGGQQEARRLVEAALEIVGERRQCPAPAPVYFGLS